MKLLVALFMSCLAVSALAENITTLNGRILTNAVIMRHDAVTVTIHHLTAIEGIPFTNLPVEIRIKYGYDEAAAAAQLLHERVQFAKTIVVAAQHRAYVADLQSKVLVGGHLVATNDLHWQNFQLTVSAKDVRGDLPGGASATGVEGDLVGITGADATVFLPNFQTSAGIGERIDVPAVEEKKLVSGRRCLVAVRHTYSFQEWQAASAQN